MTSLNDQINDLVAEYVREQPQLDVQDVLNEIQDAASDAPVIFDRVHAALDDTAAIRTDAAA